jgi:hypothetical protein
MQQSDIKENNPSGNPRLRNNMLVLALVSSVIIGAALIWNLADTKKETNLASIQMARVALQKDIMYRAWCAMHGGVYVPVSDATPPNSYLSHVRERDITAPGGRQLTLMNPA